MTKVFADTAFFVGLLNEKDSLHSGAKRLVKQYAGRMLTSYWVLVELANYFADTPHREIAGSFINAWIADPNTECVKPDVKSFSAGLRLYRDREDKEWSLTGLHFV